MDASAAEERYRGALLHVLAMLFAMIGLVRGGMVATLPRHLRLRALRLLRPAESAVRRLGVVAAQKLAVQLPCARTAPVAASKKAR